MSNYIKDVLQIFEKGVNEVTGFNSVGNFLNNHKISGNYQLIAIGKAADSMSLAVMKSKNINIRFFILNQDFQAICKEYSYFVLLDQMHLLLNYLLQIKLKLYF